jgi:hypothetical protein
MAGARRFAAGQALGELGNGVEIDVLQPVNGEGKLVGSRARRQVLDAGALPEEGAGPEVAALHGEVGRLVELHVALGIEPRRAALHDAVSEVALRRRVDGQLGAGGQPEVLEVQADSQGVRRDDLPHPQALAVRQVVPETVTGGELQVATDAEPQGLGEPVPLRLGVGVQQGVNVHGLQTYFRHQGEIDAQLFRGSGAHRLQRLLEARPGDGERFGASRVIAGRRFGLGRHGPESGGESHGQQEPACLTLRTTEQSSHADLLSRCRGAPISGVPSEGTNGRNAAKATS